MNPSIAAELERLQQLKTAALRTRYREVFGEESRSSNRQSLLRRIAWRLQARAEGDLSERARRRALEIADDADLRLRAPQDFLAESAPSPAAASPHRTPSHRDARLPVPGTVLTRQYETSGSRRLSSKISASAQLAIPAPSISSVLESRCQPAEPDFGFPALELAEGVSPDEIRFPEFGYAREPRASYQDFGRICCDSVRFRPA